MPGTARLTIIALDAVGSAIAGPSLGLQGDTIALGTGVLGAGKLNQIYEMPIDVYVIGRGAAVGTVVWETSPLGAGAWTQWGSPLVFAAAGQQHSVGKLKNVYIRARVSAWTSGTFHAYVRPQ